MVNKPTHLCGSLIDRVYVKKNQMEESFTNVTSENIYFLDHDDAKTAIEKNYANFHFNP